MVTEEMQVAVALISSSDGVERSSALMQQILSNIVRDPNNLKYCKLRASNPKIAELLDIPGAADLLAEAGFQPVCGAEDEVFLEIVNPSKVCQC